MMMLAWKQAGCLSSKLCVKRVSYGKVSYHRTRMFRENPVADNEDGWQQDD